VEDGDRRLQTWRRRRCRAVPATKGRKEGGNECRREEEEREAGQPCRRRQQQRQRRRWAERRLRQGRKKETGLIPC
jgi:hypothetical protein